MRNIEKREERKSSPSFDWMYKKSNEAYLNKQVESSRQQCRYHRNVVRPEKIPIFGKRAKSSFWSKSGIFIDLG